MTDQYIRRNGKWAKVSGSRGKFFCAKGWEGSIAAGPNMIFSYPTKSGAMIAAKYWVED